VLKQGFQQMRCYASGANSATARGMPEEVASPSEAPPQTDEVYGERGVNNTSLIRNEFQPVKDSGGSPPGPLCRDIRTRVERLPGSAVAQQ